MRLRKKSQKRCKKSLFNLASWLAREGMMVKCCLIFIIFALKFQFLLDVPKGALFASSLVLKVAPFSVFLGGGY